MRTGFPVRSPGRAAKLYGVLFTDNLGKSCEPAAAQVGPGADRQRCCSRARAPGRSPQGAPRSSIWLTCKQGVAEGQLRAPPCALPGLAVLTSLMASDELMRAPPATPCSGTNRSVAAMILRSGAPNISYLLANLQQLCFSPACWEQQALARAHTMHVVAQWLQCSTGTAQY